MKALRVLAALGLLAVASAAWAKTPPKPIPAEGALKVFEKGDGEALAGAVQALSADPELLTRRAKALAPLAAEGFRFAVTGPRLLDLVRSRGGDGCAFIGSLVGKTRPSWTKLVVSRYLDLPSCPGLRNAIGDALEWVDDPGKHPEATDLVSKILAIVAANDLVAAGEIACRFVTSGTEALRREAIETMLATKTTATETCLVRGYHEARADATTPAGIPGMVDMRMPPR